MLKRIQSFQNFQSFQSFQSFQNFQTVILIKVILIKDILIKNILIFSRYKSFQKMRTKKKKRSTRFQEV